MSEKTFRNFSDYITILVMLCLFSVPGMGEGFTVQSVTKENDYFRIALVLNDGGQAITGYINGSEFQFEGLNVSSKIKLEISKITESLNYAVLNQGTLWKYDVRYYDAIDFYTGAVCPGVPAYCFLIDVPGRIGFGTDRIIVINRVPAGSYGGLQNPDLSWIGTMTLTIDDKQYKQNIGSGEAARGAIQFPIANVQWVGSLVTGKATPNQNLYTVIHKIDTTRWNIAPKTEYEKYLKSLTETDTILNIWDEQQKKYKAWQRETYEEMICQDVLCSAVANMITLHNANVETLLSKNVKIDYDAVTASSSISGYDGNIYDIIDHRISNPELIIRIKANALSVSYSIGKPKIERIDAPAFASGDNNGYVRIYVQNVGNASGTFAARTNRSPESPKVTLQPGEQGILTLFLSDINSSIGNIEVYDINSGESDEKDFQIIVTQARIFIPNTTRVYNDLVTTSDVSGMYEYKELDCSSGIFHFSYGEYQCTTIQDTKILPVVQETIKPPQSFIIDPPKKESIDYSWLLFLILGILLTTIAMSIVSGRSNNRKKGYAPLIFVGLLVVFVILLVLYWENVQDFGNNLMIEIIKMRLQI